MICAIDRSLLAFGWKKYLTTASLLTDCDSVCSTSLTTVCAERSENRTMRFAISSGRRPVYRQITAAIGILMSGKMSVGVLRIE